MVGPGHPEQPGGGLIGHVQGGGQPTGHVLIAVPEIHLHPVQPGNQFGLLGPKLRNVLLAAEEPSRQCLGLVEIGNNLLLVHVLEYLASV
jgi:hypothetical protein